jgi:hypothetical protein
VCSEAVVENLWYRHNDPERLKSGRLSLVGMGVALGLANREDRWSSRDGTVETKPDHSFSKAVRTGYMAHESSSK